MKKAVIILAEAIENNTSSNIRCSSIIQELPALGYDVVCYCPHPFEGGEYNDESKMIESITIKRFGTRINIKSKIDNAKQLVTFKQKVIMFCYRCFKKVDVFGASLQYLRFRKSIKNDIKKENADILISFSDPMTAHMIGKYCQNVVKGQYIQQWGDPLATDTISKIALPVWIRKIIERELLKKADRICYVSPFTCDEQKVLYKKYASRMIFLPTPRVNFSNSKKTASNKLKIGYIGGYNLVARDIRPLYKAANRLDSCELYIIGDSDLHLDEKSNIIIKSRVPRSEVDRYVQEMDVLVCLMNSKGNQIPGKMYHYTGSDKEILVITDGEYAMEIEAFFTKYNRYTFVNNDPDSICEQIKRYTEVGVPERTPLADFAPNNIARQLMDFSK